MADLPDWVRRDGDALLVLEARARRDAGAGIRAQVAELTKRVLRLWVQHFGSLDSTPTTAAERVALDVIRQAVTQGLAAVNTNVTGRIRRDADRAATLGATLGAGQAAASFIHSVPVSPVVERVLSELGTTMDARLEVGQRLAARAASWSAVNAALATGSGAANSAERTATWATMRRANEGVREQARAAGADVIWVAERDACLYCLAQSGEVRGPRQAFDGTRRFDTVRHLTVWPEGSDLWAPPRHPECRCHLVVYRGHVGPGPTMPEVLKREAQRSVVIGLALPSESQTVRARAAQKLVDADRGAPPTVLARTRRQLIAGTFRTRSVSKN